MKHKKLISIITLGAIAIATVFGAVLYRTVLAAGPAQSAGSAQAANTGNPGKGFGGGLQEGYSNQERGSTEHRLPDRQRRRPQAGRDRRADHAGAGR